MPKVGRTLLFAIAFFAISGAVNTTFAKDTSPKANLNACETNLASYLESCPTSTPSALHLTNPQNIVTAPQIHAQTSSATIPTTIKPTTMPALNSQMASDAAVLDSDKIFNLVNDYRVSQNLAPFEKNDEVCTLAQTRSTEIPAEIKNGTLHSGLYNRPLPYWIWENAKYGSNEEGTVAWWLASPLHHKSIVGDYKYSCVKCTGSYCSQLFTSFIPK